MAETGTCKNRRKRASPKTRPLVLACRKKGRRPTCKKVQNHQIRTVPICHNDPAAHAPTRQVSRAAAAGKAPAACRKAPTVTGSCRCRRVASILPHPVPTSMRRAARRAREVSLSTSKGQRQLSASRLRYPAARIVAAQRESPRARSRGEPRCLSSAACLSGRPVSYWIS